MRDPFFICQELIDVLAVSPKQILAVLDSHHHGVEFIRMERKKGKGKAIEFHPQLPISALQRRVNLEPKSVTRGFAVMKLGYGKLGKVKNAGEDHTALGGELPISA